MPVRLIADTHASSCYFRTSVGEGERKALVQITERCNLHCAHCFVSSTRSGLDLSLDDFRAAVLPRLERAKVRRLTLTGGEPFVHPDLVAMCALAAERGLPVGVCTNATQVTDDQIDALRGLGNVHVNVSFDGFRSESHGRFRGDRRSFDLTVETTRRIAAAGLLQGLLSTPNRLADPAEFGELCAFAESVGADYVLMNPLSSFGRGVASRGRLEADDDRMRAVRQATAGHAASGLDVVPIRFPNDDLPLGGCEAGRIIYVFADGLTAVCPYLVFAARTPGSRHREAEFTVGNILVEDIAAGLDSYRFHDRYAVGANDTCRSCRVGGCGKGCPAAVVAAGERIGAVDTEQCPVADGRRSLPLTPV